jgi:hypothetical protein
LNIRPIYRFRVISCTRLDSGLMAGLILRQVYGKMSLKTIIHTIPHQLINQGILSLYWSFTFSKSCNDLTSRYNASMNRYNVSTNHYNAFRRYQICQKIGQYGVKMLTTLCISFNVSESRSNDSRNRYNDLWYMLTFQRMVQALLTSCEALWRFDESYNDSENRYNDSLLLFIIIILLLCFEFYFIKWFNSYYIFIWILGFLW